MTGETNPLFGRTYNRGIPGQRGWPSPPGWEQGLHLGTAGTVAEYTEIFEFAARLAVSAVGDERMYVEVTLKGLRNRELYVDDPGKVPFHWQRAANIDEFPFQIELSRAELVARSRDLALEAAQKLYRYFQWDVGIDLLRGLQGEFIRS